MQHPVPGGPGFLLPYLQRRFDGATSETLFLRLTLVTVPSSLLWLVHGCPWHFLAGYIMGHGFMGQFETSNVKALSNVNQIVDNAT